MNHNPIHPTLGASNDSLDGAVWHKSSYSGTQGNCVEVTDNLDAVVAVRDSKNPDGPILLISFADWRSFVRLLKLDSVH